MQPANSEKEAIRDCFQKSLIQQIIFQKRGQMYSEKQLSQTIEEQLQQQSDSDEELIILNEHPEKIIKKVLRKEIIFFISSQVQRQKYKNQLSIFSQLKQNQYTFCSNIEETQKKVGSIIQDIGFQSHIAIVVEDQNSIEKITRRSCIKQFHVLKNQIAPINKTKNILSQQIIKQSENYQQILSKLKREHRTIPNFTQNGRQEKKEYYDSSLWKMDNIQELSRNSIYLSLWKMEYLKNPANRQKAKDNFERYIKESFFEDSEIQKFIKEYPIQRDTTTVFQWYCSETFFYKIVNKSLRSVTEIQQLLYLSLPFSDIFQSIQELYRKQEDKEFRKNESFLCYRGCLFTNKQLKYFQKNEGQFVAMEGFISTSQRKKVAVNYVFNSGNTLLEIQIKKSNLGGTTDYGFADISQFSPWGQSQILINTHIFKIVQTKQEQVFYEYWPGKFQKRKIPIIRMAYNPYNQILQKIKKNQELSSSEREFISFRNKLINSELIFTTNIKGKKVRKLGELYFRQQNLEKATEWYELYLQKIKLKYQKHPKYPQQYLGTKIMILYIQMKKQDFQNIPKQCNELLRLCRQRIKKYNREMKKNQLMIDKYKLLISLIYSYKGYSNEKKKIRYKNDYESAMKEIEQIEHPTLLKTKIKMKKMLQNYLSIKSKGWKQYLKNKNETEKQLIDGLPQTYKVNQSQRFHDIYNLTSINQISKNLKFQYLKLSNDQEGAKELEGKIATLKRLIQNIQLEEMRKNSKIKRKILIYEMKFISRLILQKRIKEEQVNQKNKQLQSLLQLYIDKYKFETISEYDQIKEYFFIISVALSLKNYSKLFSVIEVSFEIALVNEIPKRFLSIALETCKNKHQEDYLTVILILKRIQNIYKEQKVDGYLKYVLRREIVKYYFMNFYLGKISELHDRYLQEFFTNILQKLVRFKENFQIWKYKNLKIALLEEQLQKLRNYKNTIWKYHTANACLNTISKLLQFVNFSNLHFDPLSHEKDEEIDQRQEKQIEGLLYCYLKLSQIKSILQKSKVKSKKSRYFLKCIQKKANLIL